MSFIRNASGWLIALPLLAGCVTVTPPAPGDSPAYLPTAPLVSAAATNRGAIYQPASSQNLFEDYKARRIGDLLTVTLSERTNASKSASTSTSKEGELELGLRDFTVMGYAVPGSLGGDLLNAEGSTARSFDGSGDASQSNRLTGEITVTVAEVLANGNLVVQGEKWLGLNQGNEYVRLRGIVRPVDISARNSVLSTQLANVQVYYGGTGALADSNEPGWLSRFFNLGLWPF